jgi:tetratricopeptide (TPR) repeat protein
MKKLSPSAALFAAATLAACSNCALANTSAAGAGDVFSAQVPNPVARKLVSDANQALKGGHLGLARLLLTKAVALAPKDGVVRVLYGRVLLATRDAGRAEVQLRLARSEGARDTLVLPSLFQAMLAQHEEQKLLNEFGEPEKNSDRDFAADVLNGRALALLSLGHLNDAAAAMDRSLLLRRDALGLNSRAEIAIQQGNFPLALKILDEALELDPKNHHVLQTKLGLWVNSSDAERALSLCEQILKLYPTDMLAMSARITLLLKLKRDAEANAAMEGVATKYHGSPVGNYYRAWLLSRAHNDLAAWQIAQSLPREFTQSNPSVAIQVSQMAIGSGNGETGAAILAAALFQSPDRLDLRTRMASVRLHQNSPEMALEALKPLKDSTDPEILVLFAQAYLKIGRTSDALGYVRKLQVTNPQRAVALLAHADNSAEVLDVIGTAKLQMKDAKGAIADLTRAHNLKPDDGEVTFHLIRALDGGGYRNAARDMLKSLLKSDAAFDDLSEARKLAADWH